jgi:hypothetical protein
MHPGTYEVSPNRAQDRARAGRHAPIAAVKIPAQAELGRGTLRLSNDYDRLDHPPGTLLGRRPKGLGNRRSGITVR